MFVFSLDTNLIVAFLSVVRGLEAMENIRVLDARSALVSGTSFSVIQSLASSGMTTS